MASYNATYFEGADDDFIEDPDVDKPKRKSTKGRKLVRWSPDLDQLVLICTDYICAQQGVAIPWDDVAKEVEPFLSGEAIKQHLAKVRKYREQAGMKVPPLVERNQRRRTFQGLGTNRSRSSNIKEEDEEPGQQGSSLLYKPGNKNIKTPRSKTSQKTPRTPSGTHKYQLSADALRTEIDEVFRSDTECDVPDTKSPNDVGHASARGKRGCITQKEENTLMETCSPNEEEDETNTDDAKDVEFDEDNKSHSRKKKSAVFSIDPVHNQPPPRGNFQLSLPNMDNAHPEVGSSGLHVTTGLGSYNLYTHREMQEGIFGPHGTNSSPMITFVMNEASPYLYSSNSATINTGNKEYEDGVTKGTVDNFAYPSTLLPNPTFTPILRSEIDREVMIKNDVKQDIEPHSFRGSHNRGYNPQLPTVPHSPKVFAGGYMGINPEPFDLQSEFNPVLPSQSSSFDSIYNNSLLLEDNSNNMDTDLGLSKLVNNEFPPVDGLSVMGEQHFGF